MQKRILESQTRDKDKKIKQQANNWIKYTENEEIRVANLIKKRLYSANST